MTSGSTSLAKPGSMPLTCSVAPPSRPAASSAVIMSSGMVPCGNCSSTGPEAMTSIPARRNRWKSSMASMNRVSVSAV